jgi:methylated-DNA-[protein]-cysteine S-methyltransferase
MVILSRGEAGDLGPIVVGEDEQGICLLLAGDVADIEAGLKSRLGDYRWEAASGARETALRQLTEYARGERRAFDFPTAQRGTEFQQRVWQILREIPFGKTRTYGDIAKELGMPNGARAVGSAIGANRMFVVVPCHRVMSPNSLAGFAGGLPMKRKLLTLEGSLPPSLL